MQLHRSLLTALTLAPALVPVSAAQSPTSQLDKVTGTQTGASSLFGISSAISGERVLVGASGQGQSGAGYIFERQPDGSWTEAAELKHSGSGPGDNLGRSGDISGERAILGANSKDGTTGLNQGAAYVFERQPDGTWVETFKIEPVVPTAFDEFGWSSTIDGDYAAVGAYRNDDVATDAGKVWVFERQPDASWVQVDVLIASDASASDDFGWSLSLSGETLLVGADRQAVPSGSAIGAVYVFDRQPDGTWDETQKLVGSDSISLDYFGWSVDIDGDQAIVGAYNAESFGDPFTWDEGAAYIFERIGGSWVQVERLEATDATTKDEFGYSVGISGGRAVVGAWDDDPLGNNSGSAYFFERNAAGAWIETAKLVPSDGQAGDIFGYSADMSGDVAVVAARGDDDQGSNSGSAYVFDAQPLSPAAGAPTTISLAAGGSQGLRLDAGYLHADELYLLLGSTSGTSPGFPIGAGLTLPLNPDFYFFLTLNNPNQPPVLNSFANLTAAGSSTATFTLPPGTDPNLAGATVFHAFGAIDPVTLQATFASNAVAVGLVP